MSEYAKRRRCERAAKGEFAQGVQDRGPRGSSITSDGRRGAEVAREFGQIPRRDEFRHGGSETPSTAAQDVRAGVRVRAYDDGRLTLRGGFVDGTEECVCALAPHTHHGGDDERRAETPEGLLDAANDEDETVRFITSAVKVPGEKTLRNNAFIVENDLSGTARMKHDGKHAA